MHSKKIIDVICNNLTTDETLADITVISEFPAVRQDVPLLKAVVSVGLEGIEVSGADADVPIAPSASPICYNFGLTLCVPKSGTGTVCHDAVDRLLASLKTVISDYSVTGISVGQMKYSGTLGALTVPITLKIYNGNAY